MKIASSEHAQNMLWTQIAFFFDIQNNLCTQHALSMLGACSEPVISMYWNCNSIDNLLLYCGLVDSRKSASEKDLPVLSEVEGQCFHYFFEDETKLKPLHTVVMK